MVIQAWICRAYQIVTGNTNIDEIIFRTTKVRNRLILELMTRGGM
jgi:hypothetical protein